MAGYEGF